LIRLPAVFFVVFIFNACGIQSKKSIAYENKIDSVANDLNKYYIELQHIDEYKIDSLQHELLFFKDEAAFQSTAHVQSSLHTAELFLSVLVAERASSLEGLKQKMKQLESLKKNASSAFVMANGNQLQLVNSSEFDDVKYKAEYLINRFYAQKLFIETLKKHQTTAH